MKRSIEQLLILGTIACVAGAADSSSSVTFNKDVLPILQKNCQSCHRPGQIAPMSFLSYQSARPWAKAMKAAVLSKKMPPWFADPQSVHFANDRSLKQVEVEILTKWADSGAPEGDPGDAPTPIQWPENGWQIKPDIIVKGPSYTVPAHPKNNVIEWMDVIVPGGFEKDTWITSIEIKPSEPSVTHHICLKFMPHADDVVYNTPIWFDKKRDENGNELPRAKGQPFNPLVTQERGAGSFEFCYVPGIQAADYRPMKAGKLIPAGTDVIFELHYTPNGQVVTDIPEVGFTVAQEEPQRRYISTGAGGPTDAESFAIPPNDPNWEAPKGEVTFLEDAELVWLSPHMHLRGKDMTYRLVFPDGRTEMVLSVPHYDFNWQLGYDVEQPIKLPKGTKLIVTAHYDNSVNNKFNPDPNRTVYSGNMTWEEMMSGFFAITVDKKVNPKKVMDKSINPGA
jgi:hypothetical protein